MMTMNINWFGIVCMVLAVVAFAGAYFLAKRAQPSIRIFWLLLAGVLAIPGLSFSFYYTHLIPESASYYHFRSLPLIEICIIPIGIAAGIFASLLPRFLLIIPLLVTALMGVVPFVKPIMAPLSWELLSDQWTDGLCRQSTSSTCGPASLATILKSHGVNEISENQLAWESYSYAGGTEAWYLARTARRRGMKILFRTESDPKKLLEELQPPAIIGVELGGSVGHFITILEKQGDRLLVGDPLETKKWLSYGELEEHYHAITGFAMEVNRGKQ